MSPVLTGRANEFLASNLVKQGAGTRRDRLSLDI
jgi:hypothetical protein